MTGAQPSRKRFKAKHASKGGPPLDIWLRRRKRWIRLAWLLGLGLVAALSVLDHTVGLDAIGRQRFAWHGEQVLVVGSPGPGRLTVQDQAGQAHAFRFAALPTVVLREQQLEWGDWVQEHAQGRRAVVVSERWVTLDPQADITGDLQWLASSLPPVTSVVPVEPLETPSGSMAMSVVRMGVLPAEAALPPEQAYVYRLLEVDARKTRRR